MSDKELLARAAKAVGYELDADGDRLDERENSGAPKPWNPLTDDGDVFRLAVHAEAVCPHFWERMRAVRETLKGDPVGRTRRAIVMVVVELAEGR